MRKMKCICEGSEAKASLPVFCGEANLFIVTPRNDQINIGL
jgi:hypothetical protein